MADYFKIVYVNTLGAEWARALPDAEERAGGQLGALKWIRDWSWHVSAYVRWSYAEPGKIKTLKGADLVILDWSSPNTHDAKEACRRVRGVNPRLPILLLKSDNIRAPARDEFVRKNPPALVLPQEDTTNLVRIAESFGALGLSLPPTLIKLHPDERDPATVVFIEWVGRERLAQAIQKYFPDAKDAYLVPVGGGWSDAKLCRLFIDNEPNEYFLKFFKKREDFTAELSQHAGAKSWLGAATVGLRLIPDVEGGVAAQSDAFPGIEVPLFPVCYESASTRERPREMLRNLYRDQTDEFVEAALARLLAVLADRQPLNEGVEPPWSDSGANCLRLTKEEKVGVIEAIQDLSMYGPPACGSEQKWNNCVGLLLDFVYGRMLPKLYQPWHVITGHIHGDPNPRNCLAHPDDKEDLLLIDCGAYKPDGRLVVDLALVERDLKLLLMGTERSAGGFRDLETEHLPDWCHFEREAISRHLTYRPADAPASNAPARRAYRLVGRVRERASVLSGRKDEDGRHYFAALLYWTLEALKYPTIRPTKKLLALYSASEIIRRFR